MSTATAEPLPVQIKTIKVPQNLSRSAKLVSEGEGTDKKFRMSISSDEPYLRYDYWNDEEYWEVLSHAPGDVDESRLKAGLPILFNHNRDQHLARAATYSNNGHRIEVTDMIWSESDFAKSKRADAINGSLPDTSVGYTIEDEGECIGAKDGKPIYKFKWAPHEASIVTVPADISVGVGRTRNKPEGDPKEIEIKQKKDVDAPAENDKRTTNSDTEPQRIQHMPPEAAVNDPPVKETKVNVEQERADSVKIERERVKKINDYVAALKNPAWKESAAKVAIKAIEDGTEFGDFRDKAIEGFQGLSKETIDTSSSEIGMSQKDVKRFSFLKAIRDMATTGRLEGFEKESCEAAQKQMRRDLKDNRSFVLPEEVSRFQNEQIFMRMFRQLLARAQAVSPATAGGFTVETTMGPLIELLRNKTVLGQAGITILDGLVGDFVMPVQTGGATAYWVSETGAITDSEATFGQKAMTPHRLGASIPFTMKFIAQTSLSADAFIRNELDIVLALKKDLAGLLGTGVGGEPLGVANTPGINATVTYGGTAAWADVVEHETGIAVDNADIGSMAFILDAATVGKWKTILKDSVAGADYLINSTNGQANGYPVLRTNQTSAAHQSFFGVWSQLLLGMWAGREITVDNITLAKTGQHQIIMNEFCDFLVRQPLAFNVSTDSAAQ